MKIKRVLILGGATIAICACLTGCSSSVEVKSTEKEKDISSINIAGTKDTEKTTNENKTGDNDTKKTMNENKTGDNDTKKTTNGNKTGDNDTEKATNENKNNNETVRVTFTELEAENRCIIVYGYDKNGDIVWEYRTPKEEGLPQFTSLEYLDLYNNEIVYLNELGTIKALDFQTGKVLWSNKEYEGSTSLCNTNDKGLYVFSRDKKILFAVDKSGNTIKKTTINDEVLEYVRPDEFEDVMELVYDNGQVIAIKFTAHGGVYSNDEEALSGKSKDVIIRLDNGKVEIK